MANSVAVIGFLYPGVEPYFASYLESLKNQTFTNFDLHLFIDHVDQISNFNFDDETHIHAIEPFYTKSIADKRFFGLSYLKSKRYSKVVFTDCDDVYRFDRVGKIVKKLDDFQIVFNDITMIDGNGRLLYENVLNSRKEDLSIENLLRFNFLGFTNTGIRLECLRSIPSLFEDLHAVDWYFFSYLIFRCGFSLSYLDEPLSFYRKYGNNNGFVNALNPIYTQKSKRIRETHYKKMLSINGLDLDIYRSLLVQLKNNQQEPHESLNNHINREDYFYLWWEL